MFLQDLYASFDQPIFLKKKEMGNVSVFLLSQWHPHEAIKSFRRIKQRCEISSTGCQYMSEFTDRGIKLCDVIQ